VTPRDLETLLATRDFLVIDIRAFAAYAKSRLVNSINVCIPTVLLKRRTLTVDDISESIVSKGDRGRFSRWKEVDGIVIYDADSLRVKDSYPLATLAGKFVEAGFQRTTYGLIGTPPPLFGIDIGGFAGLQDTPTLVDSARLSEVKSPSSPSSKQIFPSTMTTNVAVGLALECKESPLFTRNNSTSVPGPPAFFSNIRQNMDLHGGVGPLIPIKVPAIPSDIKSHLPRWLQHVAFSPDGPEILARRWEQIELAEKQRLESVLTGQGMEGRFSIAAAMERGEKNRYSNIWPFEWNRVKVPHAESGNDYFNGSYIQDVERRERRYIATQAPLPGCFEDFWKVVWGEGVQVIMALTAKEEGGQVQPKLNFVNCLGKMSSILDGWYSWTYAYHTNA
jgi:protein-tyrosine phosphatase